MTLACRTIGPTEQLQASGDPVPHLVLLHGFTQNGDCWGRFADELAQRHRLTIVDAPGHGHSRHDRADLWTAADLVVEAAGPGTYLGYSMGGRIALHAALAHPDVVEGLVLIGATPGLRTEDERAARRRADHELADRLLADGLPTFLDQWLALPLFAGLDEEAAARRARESNRPDGLAASLRHCGTGTQDPLWDRLASITAPTLAVVGDRDEKFSAIATEMLAAIGADRADLLHLPGTHAVHLERPVACAAAVARAVAAW